MTKNFDREYSNLTLKPIAKKKTMKNLIYNGLRSENNSILLQF